MAAFNLTAQLQLQAPGNVAQVISAIRRQLTPIGVKVTVAGDARSLAQINQQLQNTNKYAKASARSVGELNKTLQESARRFSVITLATGTLLGFVAAVKNSVRAAIDFEKSLVNLSQITGKSTSELKSLSDEVTRLATSFGTSSSELIKAAEVLTQAGFSAETTKGILKSLAQTTLAASFGKIQDTTEGVIASLAQFAGELVTTEQQVRFVERSLDSINAVSKAFAVESSDLITVIRRTGGVFAAAGGNIEELIALFTSVRATTRESAETIATGLRTIFTRIQRTDTVEQLKAIGIELQDTSGRFVGAYEAVRRLSEGLSSIDPSDYRFAEIIEELGGFRQVGKVIPLILQFATAQRALNVAQGASGSLAKDAETAQQSLANQIIKVKEEFDALIRKFAASETFRSIAGGALELARAFIKVANSLEPLLPLITSLFALKLGSGLAPALAGFVGIGAGAGKGGPGRISRFATGGFVPGSGNSDSVPAMLTPGEFVIKKSSAKKLGASTLSAMNNNKYSAGGSVVNDRSAYGNYTPTNTDLNRAKSRFSETEWRKMSKEQKAQEAAKYKAATEKGMEQKKINTISGGNLNVKFGVSFLKNRTDGINSSIREIRKESNSGGKRVLDEALVADVKRKNPRQKIENIEDALKFVDRGAILKTSGTPTYLLPRGAKIFQEEIIDQVPKIFTSATAKFKGTELEGKQPKINELLSNSAIGSLEGQFFEAFVRSVTGNVIADPSKDAVFDFNSLKSSDLNTLFGDQPFVLPNEFKNDASSSANIASAIGKALNLGTSPKFFASGGSADGSDTIPALLTPGEFVVNKKTASRIGYGNLSRMNKTGVAHFAKGGSVGVQKFAGGGAPQAQQVFKGGGSNLDLTKLGLGVKNLQFLDAQAMGAATQLQALSKAIKDENNDKKAARAALTSYIGSLKQGLSADEALNNAKNTLTNSLARQATAKTLGTQGFLNTGYTQKQLTQMNPATVNTGQLAQSYGVVQAQTTAKGPTSTGVAPVATLGNIQQNLQSAFKQMGIGGTQLQAVLKQTAQSLNQGKTSLQAFASGVQFLAKTAEEEQKRMTRSSMLTKVGKAAGAVQSGAEKASNVASTLQNVAFLGGAVAAVTSQMSSLDDATKTAVSQTSMFVTTIVGIGATLVTTFGQIIASVAGTITSFVSQAAASSASAVGDAAEAVATGAATTALAPFTISIIAAEVAILAIVIALTAAAAGAYYFSAKLQAEADQLRKRVSDSMEAIRTGKAGAMGAEEMKAANRQAIEKSTQSSAVWSMDTGVTILAETLKNAAFMIDAPIGAIISLVVNFEQILTDVLDGFDSLLKGDFADAGSKLWNVVKGIFPPFQILEDVISNFAKGDWVAGLMSFIPGWNSAMSEAEQKTREQVLAQEANIQMLNRMTEAFVDSEMKTRNMNMQLEAIANNKKLTAEERAQQTVKAMGGTGASFEYANVYGAGIQSVDEQQRFLSEGKVNKNVREATEADFKQAAKEQGMSEAEGASRYAITQTNIQGVDSALQALQDRVKIASKAFEDVAQGKEFRLLAENASSSEQALKDLQTGTGAASQAYNAQMNSAMALGHAQIKQAEIAVLSAKNEEDRKRAMENYNNTVESVGLSLKAVDDSAKASIDSIRAQAAAIERERQAHIALSEKINKVNNFLDKLSDRDFNLDKQAKQIENFVSTLEGKVSGVQADQIRGIESPTEIFDIPRLQSQLENAIAIAPAAMQADLRTFRDEVVKTSQIFSKARKTAAEGGIIGKNFTKLKDPTKEIEESLSAIGVTKTSVGDKIYAEIFAKIKEVGGSITEDDLKAIFAPLAQSSEKAAQVFQQLQAQRQKELDNYLQYLNAIKSIRDQELEGSRRIANAQIRTLDILEKARNVKTPDIRARETIRQRAAQRALDLGGVGVAAGDVRGLSRARTSAGANLQQINKLKTLDESEFSKRKIVIDGQEIKSKTDLLKAENKQIAILNATNKELERLGDQSERVSEIQSEIEKQQRSREQMKEFAKNFVVGGEEDRFSMMESIQGLNVAFSQGTLQNLPEDLRKSVAGLLGQLSDVKLAGGATGKEILDEFVLRDAVSMGFPPEWIKALYGATTEEEKLIQALTDLTNQIRAATQAGAGVVAVPPAEPKATGGFIGRYKKGGSAIFQSKGTDTVPAMLTPGEFVVRKSAVDKVGVDTLQAINQGQDVTGYSKGGPVYLAKAGKVPPKPAAAPAAAAGFQQVSSPSMRFQQFLKEFQGASEARQQELFKIIDTQDGKNTEDKNLSLEDMAFAFGPLTEQIINKIPQGVAAGSIDMAAFKAGMQAIANDGLAPVAEDQIQKEEAVAMGAPVVQVQEGIISGELYKNIIASIAKNYAPNKIFQLLVDQGFWDSAKKAESMKELRSSGKDEMSKQQKYFDIIDQFATAATLPTGQYLNKLIELKDKELITAADMSGLTIKTPDKIEPVLDASDIFSSPDFTNSLLIDGIVDPLTLDSIMDGFFDWGSADPTLLKAIEDQILKFVNFKNKSIYDQLSGQWNNLNSELMSLVTLGDGLDASRGKYKSSLLKILELKGVQPIETQVDTAISGIESKFLEYLDLINTATSDANNSNYISAINTLNSGTTADISSGITDDKKIKEYVANLGALQQLSTGGKVLYRAGGGSIFKPRGTDTVPAMLTPGEFVIRKSAVDKVGVSTLQSINNGDASVVNKASGGLIYAQMGSKKPAEDLKFELPFTPEISPGPLPPVNPGPLPPVKEEPELSRFPGVFPVRPIYTPSPTIEDIVGPGGEDVPDSELPPDFLKKVGIPIVRGVPEEPITNPEYKRQLALYEKFKERYRIGGPWSRGPDVGPGTGPRIPWEKIPKEAWPWIRGEIETLPGTALPPKNAPANPIKTKPPKKTKGKAFGGLIYAQAGTSRPVDPKLQEDQNKLAQAIKNNADAAIAAPPPNLGIPDSSPPPKKVKPIIGPWSPGPGSSPGTGPGVPVPGVPRFPPGYSDRDKIDYNAAIELLKKGTQPKINPDEVKAWMEWIRAGGQGPPPKGRPKNKAFGGLISSYFESGGGASAADSVPAMLTPGEFVMSAGAVSKYGVAAMQNLNRGKVKGFNQGGFVGGGVAYRQNGGMAGPGAPMQVDTSRLESALNTFTSSVLPVFSNVSTTFSNLNSTINSLNSQLGSLANQFSGGFSVMHNHEVTIAGGIDILGLDIESMATEIRDKVADMVTEKVKEQINNPSLWQKPNGPG